MPPLKTEITELQSVGKNLLRRAIAAVEFSPVFEIADESGSGIADFQRAIRAEYPHAEYRTEAFLKVEKLPKGEWRAKHEDQGVWYFYDKTREWRITLTREKLALEATGECYTTWNDFSQRLAYLVETVAGTFVPELVSTSSVRFVNLVSLEAEPNILKECASELVSITGNADLMQSDLAWRFAVREGEMLLRSGILSRFGTHDPGIYPPVEDPSWYLDINVMSGSDDQPESFDPIEIIKVVRDKVKRAHSIYAWALPAKERQS